MLKFKKYLMKFMDWNVALYISFMSTFAIYTPGLINCIIVARLSILNLF